ncbi:MAG: hypothetical protein R8K53_09665 [Mariprofundaceae bacterium]
MKHIRLCAHRAVFLAVFFVAIAGLSACGGGNGTSTTTSTGAGVSGSGG